MLAAVSLEKRKGLIGEEHSRNALSGPRNFLASENPLKLIKNAFYFNSKTNFVLNIIDFLCWRFGYVAGQLDQKDIRLISKLMTSQPG